MLGVPIPYLKGMRLMTFQLSGFYYDGTPSTNPRPQLTPETATPPLQVDEITLSWGFPKIRGTSFWVLIIRIPPFGVLY